MSLFKLKSNFLPAGDQPKAITDLVCGLEANIEDQILLGITGSGKTFTIANIIEKTQRPALILAHNKTLAAQLYGEMCEFFPENAVGYFVSFYDYYQPEAYIARTDSFIEKDSTINEQIDQMRHFATRALLERRDTIIVASVSCIYGIGSPEFYGKSTITIKSGEELNRQNFLRNLVLLQYKRNDIDFSRCCFRVRGDVVDIFAAHLENVAWRVSFFGDEVDEITEFEPLTGKVFSKLSQITIYAASHYITPEDILQQAIKHIKTDLNIRISDLENAGRLVEAQRIKQRTNYDLEMFATTGSCKGIENYSRYLTGRPSGSAPPTLFEYLPKDALIFVDESHVSIPQIDGMYKGDYARKSNLIEYGFRLPSALDNRPLKFAEWELLKPQTIYVSATPGKYELAKNTSEVIQQIIRPTGLLDPECFIRPSSYQVDDVVLEINKTRESGFRTLITTLTKKSAEDLSDYLSQLNIKVVYMHSDIDTLERIAIIRDLRLGKYDCLIGVNLLREGLDIPECALVAIFDADKEGFLRNETSLIQTIGRAARNSEGKVIIYADKITKSIEKALAETARRRQLQILHNLQNNITPKTTSKPISNLFEVLSTSKSKRNKANKTESWQDEDLDTIKSSAKIDRALLEKDVTKLKQEMKQAANELNFELATKIRNNIKKIEECLLIS